MTLDLYLNRAIRFSQTKPIEIEVNKRQRLAYCTEKKRRDTYCPPMYSAADLEPLLFSSSAGDEKRHMLLPHCPLVSGYALEVEPNFSFLVSTEKKKKKRKAHLVT